MSDVVFAFVFGKQFWRTVQETFQFFDIADFQFSQDGFQLRETQFNRVEVGAVGRQVQSRRTLRDNQHFNIVAFVRNRRLCAKSSPLCELK